MKTLRYAVIAAYVAISVILLIEIAWSWPELAASISEYLSSGAAGYITTIIVFTAPVSSMVIAFLVRSDASGFVMVPFVVHTIVAFPVSTGPAILLIIYKWRGTKRDEAE